MIPYVKQQTTMAKTEARGWRNNNPLNIEYNPSNRWRGQVGSDGRFAIFSSREYGYRAALVILRNYQRRYGLTTLKEMIWRWCPPSERGNDTIRYIGTVSVRGHLPVDKPLDLGNKSVVVRLLEAMTFVECGRPGDEGAIRGAFEMLRYGD